MPIDSFWPNRSWQGAMLRGAKFLLCLIAAVLAVGIAAAPYQSARADVTITFLPDGSNVKMVYSGTITGTPVGASGLGSSANFQSRRDIAADNNTSINAYYNISPTTDIFSGGTNGISGNTSTGPVFWLDIQQAKFYVGSNSAAQTLSGVVIFPNAQISDLGTVLTSAYSLANTTGGPGGTADRIHILVDPGSPTVTSVSPNTGPEAGGTSVTITGTGFMGATAVTFGGTAATSFTVDSATQITAVTPSGTAGAVDVVVTAPGGSGTGTGAYSYSVQSGSVQAQFDSSRDDIKRIIQDQAEKRLTTLMRDNDRMMQDVRTRFIGFAEGGQNAGLTSEGFDAIAFHVDGAIDVEGGQGIVAASSGEFLRQTGMMNGANWRLSGNFDVLMDGDQSLAAVDARLAREQFLTRNILWGAFGGGQFSNSDIADTFDGSETTWQIYAGTYAVGKLANNLFADSYASLGYGWSDLSMSNEGLALDSTYGSLTWQVGGSLAGLIELERFSLLPTLSMAYGNSNLGEIDFRARAYGISDNVSLGADRVAMGVLRLTPEVRIPISADATADDGVVLGLLPRLICEQVVADNRETRCGWGAGLELTQAGTSGLGQFSGKLDFQQVGGIRQVGGQIGYSMRF